MRRSRQNGSRCRPSKLKLCVFHVWHCYWFPLVAEKNGVLGLSQVIWWRSPSVAITTDTLLWWTVFQISSYTSISCQEAGVLFSERCGFAPGNSSNEGKTFWDANGDLMGIGLSVIRGLCKQMHWQVIHSIKKLLNHRRKFCLRCASNSISLERCQIEGRKTCRELKFISK